MSKNGILSNSSYSILNLTSAICNMTNHTLTKQEIELFSKGLDFGIFPNYLNYIDLQTEFESFFQDTAFILNSNNDKIKYK